METMSKKYDGSDRNQSSRSIMLQNTRSGFLSKTGTECGINRQFYPAEWWCISTASIWVKQVECKLCRKNIIVQYMKSKYNGSERINLKRLEMKTNRSTRHGCNISERGTMEK